MQNIEKVGTNSMENEDSSESIAAFLHLWEYRCRQLRPQDQSFHSGGFDRWGDGAGSCEKYGSFAGAFGAESEGDAAEVIEYEPKNGIRSDFCI